MHPLRPMPPRTKEHRAADARSARFGALAFAWLACLAALGIMAALAPRAAAADWNQWRGPNRDGKSTETGLLKSWPTQGPKKLWTVEGIGEGYSSAAVAGGTTYVTGAVDGKLLLTAIDDKGKTRYQAALGPAWRRDFPGTRGTPTVIGGQLFVMSGDGDVYACDPKNGKVQWRKSLTRDFGGGVPQWGYSESILVHDGMAIVTPGGRKGVVALDAKTGRTQWTSPANGYGAHYISPIAVDYKGREMIIQGNGGGLFGLDAKSGKVLWQDPVDRDNTANCCTPAHEKGYVFWANGYGRGGACFKLGGSRSSVKATKAYDTDMDCHHGGYVIHDGHVYGNDRNGYACLDLETGQRKWRERGVGKGSVIFADGMLILFGERGGRVGLAEATPKGLTLSGQFNVPGQGQSWAHPSLADGKLYIRYGDGVHCFAVK